jgi:hypothetical protein
MSSSVSGEGSTRRTPSPLTWMVACQSFQVDQRRLPTRGLYRASTPDQGAHSRSLALPARLARRSTDY